MERKYIINPKLAIEKIVRGGQKLKKQALRISSSIKNNIINGWNKGTKYISDNVEKVQKFINLGKAAIKTSEEIAGSIARKHQKYDAGLEHVQNEIAEMQRWLGEEIRLSTGKIPKIKNSPANDNARLRLVETPKKTVATARDKVVANPLITKNYVREVERITNLGVEGKQLNQLKQAMQQQEFKKLDYNSYTKHRKDFEKIKVKLRKEWEVNTGKKWPKYEKAIGNKKIGDNYDAHHLIQVDHGGPNTWWNIHPANIGEHSEIHGTGSITREIFNNK